MTTLIGEVGYFDDNAEWEHYVERLAFYFAANKIEDTTQKQAMLLSVRGAET